MIFKHHIKDQDGGILDEEVLLNEIRHALDNDLSYTYLNGKRIDIERDLKLEKQRITFVKIEYPLI